MGIVREDQYKFFIISCPVLLRNIFGLDLSCRENWNTHFMFNNLFSKIVLCEIMWKIIVGWRRPLLGTWATNTHSSCVMFIAFTLQQWLHKCASLLRYTYIACLVLPTFCKDSLY